VGQKDPRARFTTSSCDPLYRARIRKDGDGLEKALPLIRRDEDASGNPIAGDLNGFAALHDVPQKLEERVLGPGRCDGDHVAIIVAIEEIVGKTSRHPALSPARGERGT
jgi:hypothetical protein